MKIDVAASRIAVIEFQCSSASRKFLNGSSSGWITSMFRFSALQRAENSSIYLWGQPITMMSGFSALQRAENSSIYLWGQPITMMSGFSALQRAENSSTNVRAPVGGGGGVSVLFSEPKIPQSLQ